MNRSLYLLLPVFPFLAIACSGNRSEVATKLGFEKSVKFEAGSYQVHHGECGDDEFVLLAKANSNVFSSQAVLGSTVYLNGLPFIQFDRDHDGSVKNLSLNVMDAEGKNKLSVIDQNADGVWDIKIDYEPLRKSVWKEGEWVTQPSVSE